MTKSLLNRFHHSLTLEWQFETVHHHPDRPQKGLIELINFVNLSTHEHSGKPEASEDSPAIDVFL